MFSGVARATCDGVIVACLGDQPMSASAPAIVYVGMDVHKDAMRGPSSDRCLMQPPNATAHLHRPLRCAMVGDNLMSTRATRACGKSGMRVTPRSRAPPGLSPTEPEGRAARVPRAFATSKEVITARARHLDACAPRPHTQATSIQ